MKAIATEPEPVQATPASGSSVAPLALVALLYVVAFVVYTVLARQSQIPLLLPDESVYGSLAQSLANGDGLTIRGVGVDLPSKLYVYLVAPAWKISSGGDGFALAQTIGAGLVCLSVFPVWLLARRYVGPWLALAPAVLIVSGSWMLSAAGVLTENAALPFGAASLAATVAAISRPGSRWAWAALGFALLATLARIQLAILFPIIVVAVAGDCARYWGEWRTRLAAHRQIAIATGALTLAGAIAIIASPAGVLGIYERFQGAPDLTAFGKATKDQLTGLLAMAAVLPVVIVAAASAKRDAWRDDRLGPLLVVTWSAVALFLVQSAWALTTVLDDGLVPWHIQRYIEYPMPLLLVAMTVVVAWRRVDVRELAAAGAVAALILLATPGVRDVQEERGLFGLQERINSILGTSAGVSLALVTSLLVAAAIAAILYTRHRPPLTLGLVSAAVLVAYLIQAQVLWPWQDRTTDRFRAGFPASMSWIDDSKLGDVARMIVLDNPIRAEMTQFFNYDVTHVYTPSEGQYFGRRINGLQCDWSTNAAGVIQWGAQCGGPPKHLLLDNDYSKLHFYDQKVIDAQPGIGRVVELNAPPPGVPRLKALLRIPCGPAIPETEQGGHGDPRPLEPACFPLFAGGFWLDDPGRLELRFRGGAEPHTISFSGGARTETIKPRTTTTVKFPVPRGSTGFEGQLDWQQAGPAFPELIGADLIEGDGKKTNLLY